MRRRIGELAAQRRSDEWELLEGLASRHAQARPDLLGIFYIDGHVRAYHGKADVSKKHVARKLRDSSRILAQFAPPFRAIRRCRHVDPRT